MEESAQVMERLEVVYRVSPLSIWKLPEARLSFFGSSISCSTVLWYWFRFVGTSGHASLRKSLFMWLHARTC